MKKIIHTNNDEIDLAEIIRTCWDEKIKIFSIILVSIFIGFSFGDRGQEMFEGSLEINPSSNSEFVVFYPINKFFSEDNPKIFNGNSNFDNSQITPNQNIFFFDINNETSLENFINEFLNYEQLVFVLKKKDYIKEEISKLSKVEQQKKLFKYAQQFTIEVIHKKNFNKYFVKFKWNDVDEGVEILKETLDLISKKITKRVFSDLKIHTNIKKNSVINDDLTRVEYLEEQAEIANELGIETMSPIGLDTQASFNFNSSTSLNFHSNNLDYYLRGSKAIEKEISIIKNRKYREFIKIENDIDLLMNNSEIKWVDYNVYLLKIKEVKNSKTFLKISIISGFVIAFFYIVILSVLKPKKTSVREKTN